jgi:surface carbohydrate biosynthesis protein (TIGR04326 family)
MLTLWDSDATLPKQDGVVYSWNGYLEDGSVRSLLGYVERHGERLKQQYLSFTHALGEESIYGKSLIEHLSFKDGLSYWWMTVFVEKHYNRLPFVDVLRLFALEDIFKKNKPQKFLLVSANRSLHQVLKPLCYGLGIQYEWKKLKKAPAVWNRTQFYNGLPYPIQALMSLIRYLRSYGRFRNMATPAWFDNNAMFVCGYFANVLPEQASKGVFYSKYWEGMHGVINELGIKANWLHHNAGDMHQTATKWIHGFNKNKEAEGFHVFLDGHLSKRVVLNVIKKWFYLNFLYWRLPGIKKAFCLQGSSLSIWPMMKEHWKNALQGPAAITNLLSIELFERALRHMPHQKLGLYLCENHAWERALIHAWRKHGHGQLIGVAHSTVRFWDLRYFLDSRTLLPSSFNQIPQPDCVALNSEIALKAYHSLGYSKDTFFLCEALRYNYLYKFALAAPVIKKEKKVKRVLILGDIFSASTHNMLQMLDEAMSYSGYQFCLSLKPHPRCSINVENYSRLNLNKVTEPLDRVIQDYDIAYASDSTSAAVDAYCAELSVVVALDGKNLNFSPLRGQANVCFVSTPHELSESLHKLNKASSIRVTGKPFFYLDPELPKWKKLLSSAVLND